MAIHLALLVAGSLAVGVAAVVAIDGLQADFGSAVRGYEQLRTVYEIGFDAATARRALRADVPRPAEAAMALEAGGLAADRAPSAAADGNADPLASCRGLIDDALAAIRDPSPAAGREAAVEAIDRLLGRLASASAHIRSGITASQDAARHKRRLAEAVVLACGAVVLTAAAVIGVRQYRAVMRPLDRLSDAVRRFAAGDLDRRLPLAGDREFVALAADFNRMADELRGLYRDLERKVEEKSRELVRSERLASVGYLAAGVAHEINNPLGIIVGYAERSLRKLADCDDAAAARAAAERTLRVVCEEAFRCKRITDRLLSLARPGPEGRGRVSLAAVVADVASSISASAADARAPVSIDIDEDAADAAVRANAGEIRQVVLNLIVNALEATDGTGGGVRVSLRLRCGDVELAVEDDGEGMTPETLDRAFEPFFTRRRGKRSGTGLGLSIVHAIVADHGGRVAATSAGPGAGSRFVVTLPAARREVSLDA